MSYYFRTGIGWDLMFKNEMCVARKIIFCLGLFLITIGSTLPVRAQADRADHQQATSTKVLSSSTQRVLFDSSAFTAPGVPIPYSDRGYLISRKVETFLPETPNVMLYGKDGQKVREAAIWFPQSIRVAITSAAVTSDGRVVASGEADKADGTRAPFIALTDLSGKVTNVIQTKDFYPSNICVAPDNTVWSFGSTWWDQVNNRPLPGDLLRHFDFQKGQLAGYIPRSTFPDPSSHDSMTLMRCSSTAVAIISGPENAYILMGYEGNAPGVYNVSAPAGLSLVGFAILGSGNTYAALVNRQRADDPTQGLYFFELDPAAKVARLQPVEGAMGTRTKPGTVIRLWGADGEYLVLARGQDPAGVTAVHWAAVTEK